MRIEKVKFLGEKDTELVGTIWLPDRAPCMVLHIIHGMTEHTARYDEFAENLNNQGIVVVGFDLRGHGKNSDVESDCATFGVGGWIDSLNDIHNFKDEIKKRFPKLPYFMLGFSLGSFLLRDYIGYCDSKDVKGAILVGTGYQPSFILSLLMNVVKHEIKNHGFDNSTPLIDKMAFDNYNKKFSPTETSFDWLCSDKQQLSKYCTDSLCKSHISTGLFYQLLYSMRRTGKQESYRNWNVFLPILLLSGKEDPVGDFGKGVQKVKSEMLKGGLKDVRIHLFNNARHDLLHEIESGVEWDATKVIINWMLEKM